MTTFSESAGASRHTAKPRFNSSVVVLAGLVLMLSNAWALQYIFAKVIGEHRIPVFGSLLLVHLAIVVVFGSYLLAKNRLFSLTSGRVMFFVCAAGLGNVLTLAAELAAAAHIPAGLLTLIVSTAPVFTLLFTAILRTEMIGRRQLLGLLLGMGSAAFIILPQVEFGGDGLFWVLVAFIAPASFGAMAVIICAAWPKGLNAVQVAFGNAIAGLCIILPLAWVEGGNLNLIGEHWFAGAALAGFAFTLIVEYWLFALITQRGGAVFASGADFGAIALGLFWAWALFSEIPTWPMIVAGGLACSCLALMKCSAKV